MGSSNLLKDAHYHVDIATLSEAKEGVNQKNMILFYWTGDFPTVTILIYWYGSAGKKC